LARAKDPEIRARLRDQAVTYVLAHGLEDLSLRPLAHALGTSARMLVYHFESSERLLAEILAGLREREDERIQAWLDANGPNATLGGFIRWYWTRLREPHARSAARVVFEVYGLALREPDRYPNVLIAPIAYWGTLVRRVGTVPQLGEVQGTILLAAFRGLLLDFCATGDLKRTGAAIDALATWIDSFSAASGPVEGRGPSPTPPP